MKLISFNAMKKLVNKSKGKISKEAYLELEKRLKKTAEKICAIAIKNMQYEGRKTIKSRDIKEALEIINRQEKNEI